MLPHRSLLMPSQRPGRVGVSRSQVGAWAAGGGSRPVGASVAGFAAGFMEQVALDVVIFRFAAEIDVLLFEVRPQRLRELLLEIARLPDLAYLEVSARA